ncbi:solute carrier organic anion transporter family member 4A1-like isoform X2 [Apostichopus japonicus]
MTSESDNQAFVDDDENTIGTYQYNGRVGEPLGFNSKEEEAATDEEDESRDYGWFSFRPKFLQPLNNSVGFLVILSIFSFAQSMTVTGLVYVVITTIERRFNLTSLKSGFIASTYDISSMAVIIFVTYFGERGNKPVWIGIGAVMFGLGSFLFALPHFTTGIYNIGSTTAEFCNINGNTTDSCEVDDGENLSRYFGVFLLAQCLHGLGAAPLYTLGQAYIDESVKTKKVALYLGIFQAVASFAPALGFVFGGVFLSLYTDVRVDDTDINIDPSSPVWVGGWWMGFLLSGSISLLISVWVMGFPTNLPGHKEIAKARISEVQKGSEFTVRAGFGNSLSDFPKAAWTLLKNPPFMFLNGGVTMEWFILASVAVFGPKFVESQFNLSAGLAALLAGVVVVPSTLIGCGVGAWVILKFNLDFRGQMKFCFGSLVISFFAMLVFIASCDNVPFAGVTEPYKDGYFPENLNISSTCNIGCYCEQKFDPVCGSDNVMYYSACHAGCIGKTESDDSTTYTGCSCLPSDANDAVLGRCETSTCNLLPIYLVCIFIMLTLGFFTIVPSITATFRVVDFSQRAFAVGLQSLLLKALGSIPGPIIFGALIDDTCMIWEYDCDGAGTCWMYENEQFAHYTLKLIMSCRVVSLFCFAASYFTHKPIVKEDDDTPSLDNKETLSDQDSDISMKKTYAEKGVGTSEDEANESVTTEDKKK